MSAAEITAGNRKFAEAAAKRDVEAIASLYTDDAILLPPDSELVVGRDAIRQLWQSLIGGGLAGVSISSTKIEVDGDIATDVGLASMSMKSPGGASSVIEVKFFALWKKVGGRWLVHRDMFNSRAPAK